MNAVLIIWVSTLIKTVFSFEPKIGDSCLTSLVLEIKIFIGQVMGTSAGTKLFLLKPPNSPDALPGWRASSLFALCLYVFQLIVLSIRGPGCKRYEWFGGYGSKIGWWKETKKVEAGKMIDLEARGQEKKGEEIEVELKKEEKEEKEEKKKEVIV